MMAITIDGVALRARTRGAETTSAYPGSATYGRRIMSEGIVPLRRRGEKRTSLDRVDVAAVQLLASGRATSLQAARGEVILADMRAQRDQMTVVLADVRSREATGDPQIDDANVNLITAINYGIVQIDVFIARAQVFLAEIAQSGLTQPGAPE
ncbi:hypothetical protein SAMN05216360_12320 [Methylobacterium phyllostachyos]|uniref:Uncharacterized protein n=1 Tax=Methylobacterium phyllostachyos TaxID=582672 RepID=A0A1H0JNG5_9HYPH|nr:hypothetical protein [Methylobacterium phyllostachyos]SDO44891.1 hypothetical protein SAMN05216360_12320 [Methylobacterium phyllostachyos]